MERADHPEEDIGQQVAAASDNAQSSGDDTDDNYDQECLSIDVHCTCLVALSDGQTARKAPSADSTTSSTSSDSDPTQSHPPHPFRVRSPCRNRDRARPIFS